MALRYFFSISLILWAFMSSRHLRSQCNEHLPTSQPPLNKTEILPIEDGEKSEYTFYYYSIAIGKLELKINQSPKSQSQWLFQGKVASTGITRAFFEIEDKLESLTSKSPYRTLQTFLDQDEQYALGKNIERRKTLHFHHEKCQLTEVIEEKSSPTRSSSIEYHLQPGAIDLISAIHKIRGIPFDEINKISFTVFSSRKNWELRVFVEGLEPVKVPAGTFSSYKLRLQTTIGSKLEQRGGLYMWISKDHPSKPLVKMVGHVRLGKLSLELKNFRRRVTGRTKEEERHL